MMPLTTEAIYENGVLKPSDPLPLKERQKVTITVLENITWAERTAGIMGWTGDVAVAEYFASDPELDCPSPSDAP